jgi:hypothetical protein
MVVASSIVVKEHTMRRREGSGENEFNGTTVVIAVRISSRDLGWKRRRSWRSVIRRVFDGGVGWDSWGSWDMSSDSDGREECEECEVVEVVLDTAIFLFWLCVVLSIVDVDRR